jgi:hypothetical protein
MNYIEQMSSFKKEWKALPKPLKKDIDREVRWKKAERTASHIASVLVPMSPFALLWSEPATIPALILMPGVPVSVFLELYASSLNEKINDYRWNTVHVIKTHQPDWLINPPPKKSVSRLLNTPVAFPTEAKAQF